MDLVGLSTGRDALQEAWPHPDREIRPEHSTPRRAGAPRERPRPLDRPDLAPEPELPEDDLLELEEILTREIAPHVAMLRQVAQRILGCADQAQDAVQEAIVALWKLRDRPPELRGWLVKTVIHRSLHRRRTELRRQRWEDQAAVAAAISCPLCSPEDEIAQRELLEVVEAAVARLGEEHQIVIALRSQGLEYEEIARQLGLPIGTVRSRLNRARRALRDRLPAVEL